MAPRPPDWQRLQRLRDRFLAAGSAPGRLADYWREDADLEAYDLVLAQRIGWKWDAVFDELEERGVDPRGTTIVDWGCGTGIASRGFVARFGGSRLVLHDRSQKAMAFAARRALEASPELHVEQCPAVDDLAPDVLLISHVLSELGERAQRRLLDLVRRSRRVIWVEAGNRDVARRLAAVHDALRDAFTVLAPCCHEESCRALLAGDEHWCHFFARPPAGIFQDPHWVEIGRRLSVDLRSLPYSFLALAGDCAAGPLPELAPGGVHRPVDDPADAGASAGGDTDGSVDGPVRRAIARVVGRAELRKREARLHTCDRQALHRQTVAKSEDPELFRRLKKQAFDLRWW